MVEVGELVVLHECTDTTQLDQIVIRSFLFGLITAEGSSAGRRVFYRLLTAGHIIKGGRVSP
jgi:hypothetical protein